MRSRLVFGCLLALLGCLPASAEPSTSDAPACKEVTPLDAPYGCLEIFPLGASAAVTFDGVSMGLSPLGIPNVEPGDHTLRLDRTGFYPWYAKLTITPGEVLRID